MASQSEAGREAHLAVFVGQRNHVEQVQQLRGQRQGLCGAAEAGVSANCACGAQSLC
jgi:hypothetical protein